MLTRFGVLRRTILLGVAAVAPALGFGALTWEARKIELIVPVESTQGTAIFHFRNSGPEPVTITAVKPSCGCTAVELAKSTYAAGEAGELRTVSTFGGGLGLLEKSVDVTTSDAPAKPVSLVIRFTIPQLFTYSSRLFIWRVGEEPADRSATVTCLKELTGITVGPNPPAGVVCRVEPPEAGKICRILLHPTSTAAPASLQVPLVATLADRTTRPLVLFVLVR